MSRICLEVGQVHMWSGYQALFQDIELARGRVAGFRALRFVSTMGRRTPPWPLHPT